MKIDSKLAKIIIENRRSEAKSSLPEVKDPRFEKPKMKCMCVGDECECEEEEGEEEEEEEEESEEEEDSTIETPRVSYKVAKSAENKGKTLNKPFRLPSGSRKKFGVYVKNEKGNVVKVTFGDPNMTIKRDDPNRRKNFRSRHGCDNPGPKWKANYWSCKMWEAKKSVTDYTKGSFESEAGNGLWYNIKKKKERMGKNYKPAPIGSKDRPTPQALKKAQSDEWDGLTFVDERDLLKIDPTLVNASIIEDQDLCCDECGGENVKLFAMRLAAQEEAMPMTNPMKEPQKPTDGGGLKKKKNKRKV